MNFTSQSTNKKDVGLIGKLLVLGLILLVNSNIYAQIGLLTNSPDASAQLDIFANSKGLLIPRIILSSDLNNSSPVNSPEQGLLIYNSGNLQQEGFYYWVNNKWQLIKTPNPEEVIAASSSTDNAIVRFDGTSGKKIQNSSIILNDNDQINQVNNISLNAFQLTSSPTEGQILTTDAAGNASWQSSPPIDVNKDNTLVTANASTLNFVGSTKVIDEGNNKASIIFYTNNVTKDVIQLSSSDSSDLNNLSGVIPIVWDIEQHKDNATFLHSSSTNANRISVNTTGIYELNYMFSAINNTISRKTLRTRIRKNNSIFLDHITSYSFSYHEADDQITQSSSSFLIQLNENDYIELVVNGQTNSGPISLVPNENVFFMRLIREL